MDLYEIWGLLDSEDCPRPDTSERPPQVDPLEGWPHRELLGFVEDTFRNYLSKQQDQLRALAGIGEAHEATNRPLGLQPSRYVEDMALLCLQTRLQEEWSEKGQVTVTPRTDSDGQPIEGFPDIQIYHNGEVIIGVEVKSYEVTCKERMPTARFQVSPSACQPQDLVVIIPWIWNFIWPNVGHIHILPHVFVEPCHRVIRSRDAAWRYRGRALEIQEDLDPRQLGVRDHINADTPGIDHGNNFGRVGRIPLVKEWTNELMALRYAPKGWSKRQPLGILWSVLWESL